MNYIWINPVALSLYDKDSLYQRLQMQGYTPVECQGNQAEIVLAQYQAALEQAEGCVVDMRCPAAVEYLRQNIRDDALSYPSIHPILIHCTLELHKTYIDGQPENHLIITTPCTDLCAYGDALGLARTSFYSWNEFDRLHPTWLPRKALAGSPIPPGFFSSVETDVLSLCSKGEIDRFFTEKTAFPHLLELLFCENGCHNGDGIVGGGGNEG